MVGSLRLPGNRVRDQDQPNSFFVVAQLILVISVKLLKLVMPVFQPAAGGGVMTRFLIKIRPTSTK